MADAFKMRRDLMKPGQYSAPVDEHVTRSDYCLSCTHRKVTKIKNQHGAKLPRQQIRGKCKLTIQAIGVSKAKVYAIGDTYGCSRFVRGVNK